MNIAAISVKNLYVKYGANNVLQNVNFEIAKGSITAVIGPNGSGKSTLFKAILGLMPFQGQIKIFKKPMKQVLTQVGYVPQYFEMDRTLPITVNEFLSLANFDKNQISKSICREVHVDSLAHKKIGELSGGQLQRVLLANALMSEPQLLLLDEAAAGIDIEGAKTFYELIQHVNKEHGVTVVFISHEINMVYKYANQIICLNHDLVCNGTPKQALTAEVMEKLYGSDFNVKPHKHL